MLDYSPIDPVAATFVVIPVALAALLLWATARAYKGAGAATMVAIVGVCTFGWMTGTWLLASSGVFRQWDRTPPPFAFLILAVLFLSGVLALTPLGRRLAVTVPLWALILVQGFRFPLELAMHEMYERGVMPVQMSYSGRNFDIVTGASAVVVALLVRKSGRRALALAWNVVGLLLVLNVASVGVLSTPRFRYFGDDRLNVWITYPPYVWLPAVMVLAAIAGHLLIFRALGRPANQLEATGQQQ